MTNGVISTQVDSAAAFQALYEEYVDRIYRYHLIRSGDPLLAEDLTAETFRAALESFGRYQPAKASPGAWLAGIANHKLVDAFRRRRREQPLEQAAEHPVGSVSTEDTVARRLQMDTVARAMKRISPERAEALALHFFSGLTIQEAAQVMKKNPEAVKKLVQRGLADLRLALAKQEEVA